MQALTGFDTKPYRIEFGPLSMMDEETVLIQEIKRLYFTLHLTGTKAGKLQLCAHDKHE